MVHKSLPSDGFVTPAEAGAHRYVARTFTGWRDLAIASRAGTSGTMGPGLRREGKVCDSKNLQVK